MKSTILSRELLQEALDHYNEFKHLNFVVPNSLPILFFGDIDSYIKQDFKIVTAALNPSDSEFSINKKEKYYSTKYRFPDFKESIESIEKSCKKYFENSPYKNWFDPAYNSILSGLGYTFYRNEIGNITIHTDICSPLSTCPTWSRLSKEQQDLLFDKGFKLWKNLISELKPDLILLSVRNKYKEKLNPIKEYELWQTKTSTGNNYTFYASTVIINGHKSNLIFGRAGLKPFLPIGAEKKEKAGKIIKEKFLIKSTLYDNYKDGQKTNNQTAIKKINIENKIEKHFLLKQDYVGKGLTILIKHQGFKYNHDDLYNDQKERFMKGGSAFKSWSTYRYYTKTAGFPNWASEFIELI